MAPMKCSFAATTISQVAIKYSRRPKKTYMATKEHSLESKKCSADPGEARGCSIKTIVINCQSPDSLTSQSDKRNVDGSLFGWLFVRLVGCLVGWWVVVHRDVGMFKSAGSASGMAKQSKYDQEAPSRL